MNLQDKYKHILTFYKDQAYFYDLTRWTFLFGRNKLIRTLKIKKYDKILEIGSGTGSLLKSIENINSKIDLTGIDISSQMIEKASNKLKNTNLINCFFEDFEATQKYDIIIFSYTLTIVKDEHAKTIKKAKELLKKGGKIYIVDFYDAVNLYRKFMEKKEIMIDPGDLEILKKHFPNNNYSINKAYFGIWKYYLFTGHK